MCTPSGTPVSPSVPVRVSDMPARATPRREQLFDELVALLLADGFAHLTLDDIAARLRCSKRTLYALAGSKEQLVRAAGVHFFERATTHVEAAVAAEREPAHP